MIGKHNGILNPFYGKHHTKETIKKQSDGASKPRKPLVTCINILTKETKTLGRYEWYKQCGVNYKHILKGGKSNGWIKWD